ncbi:hypothetical protein GCM10028791_28450 [Echinicola sediminis]
MRTEENVKVNNLLERYSYSGAGYHPFLIRPGWQIAKLNFMPEQGISSITKIDVHFETDEAFILLNGTAVLIVASMDNGVIEFSCEKMKSGVTYNIPKNVWHNIAMKEDAEVIIVEKDRTHVSDFEYHDLNGEDQKRLKDLIIEETKK